MIGFVIGLCTPLARHREIVFEIGFHLSRILLSLALGIDPLSLSLPLFLCRESYESNELFSCSLSVIFINKCTDSPRSSSYDRYRNRRLFPERLLQQRSDSDRSWLVSCYVSWFEIKDWKYWSKGDECLFSIILLINYLSTFLFNSIQRSINHRCENCWLISLLLFLSNFILYFLRRETNAIDDETQ